MHMYCFIFDDINTECNLVKTMPSASTMGQDKSRLIYYRKEPFEEAEKGLECKIEIHFTQDIVRDAIER